MTASALSIAALGWACNRPPARLDAPKDAEPERVELADAEPVSRPRQPPLPVKEAIDLVPVGALGVAHVPSFRELMIRLGRDRFVGEHPERYDELSRSLMSELGVDPMDPDNWPRVGVDPDGPVGIALLDLRSEAFMIYFRMHDRGAFERWLARRLDPFRPQESLIGSAKVLRLQDNDEITFVLRPDFGAMVFVDRPQRVPRDFAALVAEGDARRSVHHAPRFAPLFAELESGSEPVHFMGLIDPPAILDAIMREEDDRVPASMPPPPDGATQADLDAWEAQARDMERFAREDRERRARERAGYERIFGEVTGLGGTVSLRESEVSMRGVALLAERSLWRELGDSGDAPAVLGALTRKPLVISGGRVRTDAALRMLDRVAAVDGASPERVRREFAKEFGIGLDELAGALRGDLGFAITQARSVGQRGPKQVDRKRLEDSYGYVLTAGLEDPGAASRLLGVFASHGPGPNGKGLRRDDEVDAYVVDVDGREAYLAIIGDQAVVATDRAVLAQVRKGGPTMLERRVSDEKLRALLERPGVLNGYLDGLWLELESLYLPYPVEAVDPVIGHPQLTAEELARIPKSKAYRIKFREYEKTLAKVKKVQAKRASRQLARAVKMGQSIGKMAIAVRAAELGYVLDSTWKLGVRDFAALADAFGNDSQWAPNPRDDEQERRVEERRWRLEDELRELRMKEIEAYLSNRRSN